MLLTTRQVAEKLGVNLPVVRGLVMSGKLPAAVKSGDQRMNYGFDHRVVAEFKKTYVPNPPRTKKTLIVNVKTGEVRPGNGHAELPLDIPSSVQLFTYLQNTRIELGTRLGVIEERIAKLMAVWGVE